MTNENSSILGNLEMYRVKILKNFFSTMQFFHVYKCIWTPYGDNFIPLLPSIQSVTLLLYYLWYIFFNSSYKLWEVFPQYQDLWRC